MSQKQEFKTKDYERLGRLLQSVVESGYADKGRLYRYYFLRGVFYGLGFVVGGTLIVGLVIWVLSFFTQIPIIGDFVETIEQSVESKDSGNGL